MANHRLNFSAWLGEDNIVITYEQYKTLSIVEITLLMFGVKL